METKAKTRKSSKRILSVKIKRMVDESPDTSHMGEYSDKRTSEFSIDRDHSEDCAGLSFCKVCEGAGENRNEGISDDRPECENCNGTGYPECDCGGNRVSSREYRYFNPSFNYVDKSGKPVDGNTPEEIRKYVRQDYERMERLNAGDWCYVGIRAEAKIIGNVQNDTPDGQRWHGTTQRISSGGLWGIESDSGKDYLESVAKEELDNLKSELLALGFSRRAIATAFKNVEEVDN